MKNLLKVTMITVLFNFCIQSVCLANTINSNDIKTYTYNTTEVNKSTDEIINGGAIAFNSPSSTYNFIDENGKLNIVYSSSNNVYWSRLDNNMKIEKTVNWPLFYNLNKETNASSDADMLTYNFANALYYNGNLYVMYSRMATYKTNEQRKEQKVMAIAKYDKNGNMLGVNEMLGVDLTANTYYDEDGTSVPFYSSNCSLQVNNGIISCFFGRNMFNGHQSSLIIFIDPSTLEYVSNLKSDDLSLQNVRRYYNVFNHSISHSFGQRLIPTSDGQFLMMESGDAGPNGSTRGLNLTKIYESYDNSFKQNVLNKSSKRVVHYREGGRSAWGYNNTYSVLGNIIEVSNGYMYIGGLEKTLSCEYGYNVNEPWNIFVQKYAKDFYKKDSIEEMQLLKTSIRQVVGTPNQSNGQGRLFLTGNEKDYGMKWLTDLNDQAAILVRAIKLKRDNIAILWEQIDIEEWNFNGQYLGYKAVDSSDKDVYFMVIDSNANVVTPATYVPNVSLSNAEQYTYKDGKIYWTTTDGESKKIKLNELNIDNNIPEVKYLKGDLDKNGVVNGNDGAIALDLYNNNSATYEDLEIGDLDGNGVINSTDAAAILDIYNSGI